VAAHVAANLVKCLYINLEKKMKGGGFWGKIFENFPFFCICLNQDFQNFQDLQNYCCCVGAGFKPALFVAFAAKNEIHPLNKEIYYENTTL